MSADSKLIQTMIATAPPQVGVYAARIELEPRVYKIDETIVVDRPVYIRGSNTAIQMEKPSTTAFLVEQPATGTRFECLAFVGPERDDIFPENGGIGLDIRAGRTIVDNCHFSFWRIAVFLHSLTEDGATEGIGNADGFTIRDCEFQYSIHGVWTLGYDAQTGTVANCRFTNCRKAITEQSGFGNHYLSNYANFCPNEHDPKATEGYAIMVPRGGVYDTAANASTFTCNWLEEKSMAEVGSGCTVVGGNMPLFVRNGDRVGSGVRLAVQGRVQQPGGLFVYRGRWPVRHESAAQRGDRLPAAQRRCFLLRGAFLLFGRPRQPRPACATPDEQGWKLRDGATTYPCKS